jgi:glycosyltransferase involved in cell wall biosynthesis
MTLVSVGIPAYGRPATLERAVRSALAQTHTELEVLISDDASPGGEVEEAGRRLAGEDSRVRFVRQPENLGHARNYQWVLENARGELFMWLADDDWLDERYVERCVAELDGAALVCGQALYYGDGRHAVDERPLNLVAARPGARLLAYFAQVNVNGALFGVARRGDLLDIGFPDEPGGDWLLVGELAARGPVRTLRDVHIHRSSTGLGSDDESLARSFGLDGFLARHHHLAVAASVARMVSRHAPAAAPLCAALVAARFEGAKALRAAGLGGLEERAVAWVRSRDA